MLDGRQGSKCAIYGRVQPDWHTNGSRRRHAEGYFDPCLTEAALGYAEAMTRTTGTPAFRMNRRESAAGIGSAHWLMGVGPLATATR